MVYYGKHIKRVIICGPRKWIHPFPVFLVVAGLKIACNEDLTIIHGDAKGVDKFADEAAKKLGIPTDPYPVDWSRGGSIAANLRNREMYEDSNPDLCIAIGYGRGTSDMIGVARKGGTPTIWRYVNWRFD